MLADLARGQLRKKLPALREALVGRFQDEHALIVGQILAHIDFLDEAIERLSAEIEEQIAPFTAQRDLLMSIPGVKQRAAEVIISEIGVDMSVFPTPKHLASWAKVSPGNDQSAGKRRSGKTGKGDKWLRATLNESANAAARTKDSYHAAQYQRLRGRRGHSKAVTAVGHSILTAAWHMLQTGELYRDLGGDLLPPPEPRPAHQTPRPPAPSTRTPSHAHADQPASGDSHLTRTSHSQTVPSSSTRCASASASGSGANAGR